jgi:hypothetical protein
MSAFALGVIKGCTDQEAANFQQIATQDDGSCAYTTAWCAKQSLSVMSKDAQAKCSIPAKQPELTPKATASASAAASASAKPHVRKARVATKSSTAASGSSKSVPKPIPKASVLADQPQEKEWKHWGAAPFAASRTDACGKVSKAIDGFNLPPAVKEHFKSALGTTCTGGTETWLAPHHRLEQMWSGADSTHAEPYLMEGRSVAELPVLKSPEGRSYRAGSVSEAAKAFSWTFVYDGKTYVLYEPLVCENWSWSFGAPVPEAPAPRLTQQPQPIIGTCPDVYTLNLRVWQESVRKLFGIGGVIDAERSIVNGFANQTDLSRRYGGRLRAAEAKGDPDAKLSETPRRFRISFINTDEARGGSSAITAEKFLFDVTVTGILSMRFKKSALEEWDAIRTVAIDDDVQSPPTFGKTGLHELRFFNRLPGKKLGEWDSNPVPDCLMNEHTVELRKSSPPLVQ